MVYTCSFLGNQLLQRCCWASKGAVVIQRVNVGKATHRLMNQTSRAGNPLLEYLCLCLLTTHSSAVATTSWWFFSNIILHLCWTFCTLWYLRWIVPRLWLTIAALCWLAMLLHLQICKFLFAATRDYLRSSINLSAVWFETCLQALLYCCLTWYNTGWGVGPCSRASQCWTFGKCCTPCPLVNNYDWLSYMKEYSLTLLLLHGSIYYLLLHCTSVIIANFPGEKNIFKKKFPPRFQDYCRLSVNKKS